LGLDSESYIILYNVVSIFKSISGNLWKTNRGLGGKDGTLESHDCFGCLQDAAVGCNMFSPIEKNAGDEG
jgi:hypothetical protein